MIKLVDLLKEIDNDVEWGTLLNSMANGEYVYVPWKELKNEPIEKLDQLAKQTGEPHFTFLHLKMGGMRGMKDQLVANYSDKVADHFANITDKEVKALERAIEAGQRRRR